MRTLLTGLCVLLEIGCVESAPCTTACPRIEGNYSMTYQPLTVETADCALLPPPAGAANLEITRSGAEIRASLNGAMGRGTLHDTSDFSISANDIGPDAGTQSYTLRGYFVPPISRGFDGGEPATIKGKWITRAERGAKICDAERPYVGLKQ